MNTYKNLMNAFAKFDFVDAADMINYRGGVDLSNIEKTCSDVILTDYFSNTNIEPLDLQHYVMACCNCAYERWQNLEDYEGHAEYYCHRTNILITINKTGEFCEISYQPITVLND